MALLKFVQGVGRGADWGFLTAILMDTQNIFGFYAVSTGIYRRFRKA
jgi:hypothetical protein